MTLRLILATVAVAVTATACQVAPQPALVPPKVVCAVPIITPCTPRG